MPPAACASLLMQLRTACSSFLAATREGGATKKEGQEDSKCVGEITWSQAQSQNARDRSDIQLRDTSACPGQREGPGKAFREAGDGQHARCRLHCRWRPCPRPSFVFSATELQASIACVPSRLASSHRSVEQSLRQQLRPRCRTRSAASAAAGLWPSGSRLVAGGSSRCGARPGRGWNCDSCGPAWWAEPCNGPFDAGTVV
jgi:hypothetical protein